MLILRAGRAETGVKTPETRRPAFQNIVGELFVQRIKLYVPDSRVVTAEEAEENPPHKPGPAFRAILHREDLQRCSAF